MSASPPGDGASALSIASRIRRTGPISFAQFMSAALHDPETGYYTRGRARIGTGGDFITSPEVSSGFGSRLAVQIAEMDRLLGSPDRFTLVELGAGSGRLAADLLDVFASDPRAGDLARRLTFVAVETSPGMRRAQEELLAGRAGASRVHAVESIEAAAALAGGRITGVFLSNEFYDALPVHLIVREAGGLQEVFVGLADGPGEDPRFERVLRPLEDPELIAYANRYGVAPEDGSEGEIGIEARRMVCAVAGALERGFHIAVDYGDEAPRLYRLRPRGTLLAYSGHRTSEEVLEGAGERDLTAHVNFTALKDAAAESGMATAGLTSQYRFLIALGLADDIATLAGRNDAASIRRRLALSALIHPEGMGRTFSVLIQYKGLPAPALSGLADPFAPRERLAIGGRTTHPGGEIA